MPTTWLSSPATCRTTFLKKCRSRWRRKTKSWLKDARFHDEDTVGRLMTPDVVSVRDTQTWRRSSRICARTPRCPDQTDRLFVVDARQIVRGSIPFHALVRADPAALTREVMLVDVDVFDPTAPAAQAAKAFEKYDLVSAPVVDERGKLIGRVDDRSRDGLRSRVVRTRGAEPRRPPRGGRSLRPRSAVRAQPLAVAGP